MILRAWFSDPLPMAQQLQQKVPTFGPRPEAFGWTNLSIRTKEQGPTGVSDPGPGERHPKLDPRPVLALFYLRREHVSDPWVFEERYWPTGGEVTDQDSTTAISAVTYVCRILES